MTQQSECVGRQRIERVERTLEAQKAFIHRVPDPDTRERAEANLIELVEMRDRLLTNLAGAAG